MATASIPSTAAVESDIPYEVINGEIVELPPMGIFEGLIASLLDRQLQCYMATQGSGWIVTEILFHFSRTVGNKRRPDLAYVSYDRWPMEKPVPRGDDWDVVPNLAVEVISPTNPAHEVVDKIADYFQAGVERVWVVYPLQRQIYVYSSPTDVRVIAEDGKLADEALLPGFGLSLSALFGGATAAK